jgi:tetratricopeptide (TPR) repeat protein
MKRSERHRLKENDLSHVFAEATSQLAERQRTFGIVGAVLLAILVLAGGYWAWHTRTETRAQVMLGDALMVVRSPVEAPKPDAAGKVVQPPGSYATLNARTEAALEKFQQVASQYPSTKAGIAARYYAASALSLLGRPAEAVTRYQEVLDRAGAKNFYGRMAQLGVVEAYVQSKQYDQAIAKAEALANASDESLPRDAMLMELGRAYAAAGKNAEARKTFDKVVAEFPDSSFAEEARTQLASLT